MLFWLVALFCVDDLAFRWDGWVSIQVKGDDSIGKVLMDKQISEIVLDCLYLELEVLILRIGQDVV